MAYANIEYKLCGSLSSLAVGELVVGARVVVVVSKICQNNYKLRKFEIKLVSNIKALASRYIIHIIYATH